MIDQKEKIEKDYQNSIIQETANDFITQLLSNGEEGVEQMLQIVYGNQNILQDQIKSMHKFIKQNKYDDYQNVKQKLNQLLSEENLKKYDGDLVLTDVFVKQDNFSFGLQQKQDDKQNTTEKNSNNNSESNINQKLFTDQIKKSRTIQTKKSLYSQEVEKLIENSKKIFWGIDMERVGMIQNKQDIDFFLDSFQQELNNLKLNLTHVEIYDFISSQLGVKIIQRIDIDQLEKIVLGFISNQTLIPLYKI